MLHLAVHADDCALAIGDGWSAEQLDELGHEAPAEFRARFEERSEKASGEGVEDHLLRGVVQAQELFTPEPGFILP